MTCRICDMSLPAHDIEQLIVCSRQLPEDDEEADDDEWEWYAPPAWPDFRQELEQRLVKESQ